MKLGGKRVAILGLGKSGIAAARFAAARGAERVLLVDAKPESALADALRALEGCTGAPIERRFGALTEAVLADADVVIASPGVSPQHPAVAAARARGAVLTNEPGLAVAELRAPLVAVTGTSGKTTTTTLIGEMLAAAGKRVFVGGNIGHPLLGHLLSGDMVDVIVAELSSFQLELMPEFSPRAVVYTPVSEDHLDRHGTIAEYHRIKRRLAELAGPEALVIVNPESPVHREFVRGTRARVAWYGRTLPTEGDVRAGYDPAAGRFVCVRAGRTATWAGRAEAIVGGNRENVMAAALAALDLGVDEAAIDRVLAGFRGIAHRMEHVREYGGVRWFNDSKATNVVAALNALGSFSRSRRLILIAGGKDKQIDFRPLRPEVERACKLVIVLGEARERLREALAGTVEIREARSLEEAVALAAGAAVGGDDVVLAPACASQDMFRDYEDRGNRFKALVTAL